MVKNSIGSLEKLSHFEVMEIFSQLSELKGVKIDGVTIGNFDGFHLGHQSLVSTLNQKLSGGASLLVTFDPHPREVIRPDHEVPRLSQWSLLTKWFEAAGLDYILRLSFDEELMKTSAKDFMDSLWRSVSFSHLVIGHDFALGAEREGNYEFLFQWSLKHHVRVTKVDPFKIDGVSVASRKIREALSEGDLELANQFLGRPYTLTGQVVTGDGRGKTIHFPTANLKPCEKSLVPRKGVYGTRVHVDEETYFAVCNIGVRPTFYSGQSLPSVEVHILNFSREIYGQDLDLEFLFSIREEKKFSSIEELKEQIRKDIQYARERFDR